MNDDRQNVTANGPSAAAGFGILWQAFAVAASPGGIAMGAHDLCVAEQDPGWSVIPKSGCRFSEKIMLHQKGRAGGQFEDKSSRSSREPSFRAPVALPEERTGHGRHEQDAAAG
jgi:hypothetical protein